VRQTIGLTLAQSFVALTGRSDPALESEYARRYLGRADLVMVPGTRVYPGVPAMLAGLRARGVRLGIVSSKRRHSIQAILDRSDLGQSVDVILGMEDVTHHKPDPQGLLAALARLQVSAGRSLYVGDHLVDAQAASGAGMSFVAVRTGSWNTEAWSGAAPLGIIEDAGGLLEWLESTGHLS
jgi:phosphoglycolate phosphatase